MVREECNKLEALDYFKALDRWCNRYTFVMHHIQKRMLSEYDYMVGESSFSQIEINRILINK